MTIQNEPKTEFSAKTQAYGKKAANYKFTFDNEVARGAGFDLAVSRASLSFRVLQFLSSNGSASLREVADGVRERSDLVGHCLRRLWKKELVFRTREPVFMFENYHKGRAGLVGNTRAVNYYALNDGDAGAIYVKYDERMNIRLLRPADFNSKLRERGVDKKVTVQKICRACKDEKDVRSVLDDVWNQPSKAQQVLAETMDRNQNVFEFEKTLAN